jgi:ornithine--oxo-acid transaminase
LRLCVFRAPLIVAIAALDVVNEENLAQNAAHLGEILRAGLNEIAARNPIITLVRGKDF